MILHDVFDSWSSQDSLYKDRILSSLRNYWILESLIWRFYHQDNLEILSKVVLLVFILSISCQH